MPDKRFLTYSIAADIFSDARGFVYGIDPELTAMVGDEAAINVFRRFVAQLDLGGDVYEARLIKDLETSDEKCIAKAQRSNGFKVVVDPEDEN